MYASKVNKGIPVNKNGMSEYKMGVMELWNLFKQNFCINKVSGSIKIGNIYVVPKLSVYYDIGG